MHKNMAYNQKSKTFFITQFNNSIDKFTIFHSKWPNRNIKEIDFDIFIISTNNLAKEIRISVIIKEEYSIVPPLTMLIIFSSLTSLPRSRNPLLPNVQFHPLSPPPINLPPLYPPSSPYHRSNFHLISVVVWPPI